MIERGVPLKATLEQLCSEVEQLLPGTGCTVLAVDAAGRIHPLAMPRFPEIYALSLEGNLIGPEAGSCGTAIYRNMAVITEDIEHDPKWAAFKTLALPLGWKACYSTPIRDEAGKAVGAIALYFQEKRGPLDSEREVIAVCTELCELAMRRDQEAADRERRSMIDSLTDLPNQAAFDDSLSQMRCELPGSWGLFVIDVDNLKATNDTLGHEIGDIFIRTVAQRISDILAPDTVFRTGDDQFCAILQNEQSLRDLDQTAAAILVALSVPAHCGGHTIVPKATIGGAVLAPQDAQPETVLRNAGFALYHAKEAVPGGFVQYWPGIGTRMSNRRDSIREVAEALRDFRIDAYYQPVIRLDTKEIVGFEALSRMTNVAGRIIPAALFQEAFTDANVACQVTDRMLAIVAKDIRAWLDEGLPVQYVGVNITSADLYTGNLPDKLRAAFDRHRVPLSHLIIEVTENAYIGRRDRVAIEAIADLRAKGVRVALDDFGTGFASLTHLLAVPVDTIKIDQSFIRGLGPRSPSAAIVRGINQIARDLDIKVVAEGIETLDQIDALRQMKCNLGQGLVFSKAVSRETARQMLRRHGQGAGGSPFPSDPPRLRSY
ncbi:GGDEF domain-containing protein [Methylovirgula sp. 4M-Z18]|nr:GGDEF domain-containing protein [Methylovirgula sp. 4M-Z18]